MKGQSLVEFAVTLTILLFLLSGLVEFGVIFFQFVQLRDAAQEGALYGSACNCSADEIKQRALSSSNSPISLLADPNVSTLVTATDKFLLPKDPEIACENDALTVQLSYNHRIFMPFIPQLLNVDYITINASVTDTVLTPVCP